MNKLNFGTFIIGLTLSLGTFADPMKPGGNATTKSDSMEAFSLPIKNIKAKQKKDFFVGKSFFRQNWVTFPSSVKSLEGLGPTFVAASCIACHERDGRGRPPLNGKEEFQALLFRVSMPGKNTHGGPVDVPGYGDQIQNFAVTGVKPEAVPQVKWIEKSGQFADGQKFTLVKPDFSFKDLAYGEFPKEMMISPRVAPAVFGLGLLEAISDADILKNEDVDDLDQDGIRGRANFVWDYAQNKRTLGRFGWKANQPSLKQQTAAAFNGDMGITTSMFTNQNCPALQTDCANTPQNKNFELSDADLNRVVVYSQLISVPARRELPPEIATRGENLMRDLACTSCHQPHFKTSAKAAFAELRHQDIYPYTDLLVHDMGEGLADHRPDFLASGREWRTPPLWGIGMIKKINKHTRFLHDGRARSLEEAILWHGGEGEASQKKYTALPKKDRDILIQFVESL